MTPHDKPTRPGILVVCTANICRSPVVEALLRQKLAQRGLSDWQVGSAGTMGVEGWPPASESQAILATQGLDISNHRSRAVTEERLAESSLVVCMEQAHIEAIARHFPTSKERLFRLAELAGEPRDVADPYGGPLVLFQHMVKEVDELLERSLERIIDLARPATGGAQA